MTAMYDELVKRLYECVSGECWNCSQSKDGYDGQRTCADKLMKQAADAIEELQQTVEQMKAMVIVEAQHTEMFDERDKKTLIEMAKSLPLQIIQNKDEKPRWIPVTKRLPLLNTPVLVTDGIEVDISWMYGVPPRWITSYTAINEDKLTHWMPLPKTPKDGDE